MLDLPYLARYRVLPDPLWEDAVAGGFVRYEDLTRTRLVLHGFVPPASPVLYATNSTQKYDFTAFFDALRSAPRSILGVPFDVVMDPTVVAWRLDAIGLHVLAWLPPLVLYAAAALYGARRIVDAFREHFGSRTRLDMLKHSVATLGAAELLFFVAQRIEWAASRTDLRAATSMVAAVERRAAAVQETSWQHIHRFPMGRVLIAITVAAFVLALARPVVPGDGAEDAAPGTIPRRYAAGVAVAALVCFVAITVLGRA